MHFLDFGIEPREGTAETYVHSVDGTVSFSCAQLFSAAHGDFDHGPASHFVCFVSSGVRVFVNDHFEVKELKAASSDAESLGQKEGKGGTRILVAVTCRLFFLDDLGGADDNRVIF